LILEVQGWFGDVELSGDGTVGQCSFAGKEPGELAERILALKRKPGNCPAGTEWRRLALDCGFAENEGEYLSRLQEACVVAARQAIKASYTPDLAVIHAVEALDDIDGAANLLAERLAVWYGDHFPELDLKTAELAEFVASKGLRSDLSPDDPFARLAEDSLGCPLESRDGVVIRAFAEDIAGLYARRQVLEEYIRENMEEVAPNLCHLAGPLLGARLISMAGSLRRLASLPSGTVQVMGANNALFKHLQSRAPSPKHGIIFNHPLVKGASARNRGKVARAFAAKLSLAARIDAFSGEFRPGLKEQLEAKVRSIESRGRNAP
jgi:nucleolar protein 56